MDYINEMKSLRQYHQAAIDQLDRIIDMAERNMADRGPVKADSATKDMKVDRRPLTFGTGWLKNRGRGRITKICRNCHSQGVVLSRQRRCPTCGTASLISSAVYNQ